MELDAPKVEEILRHLTPLVIPVAAGVFLPVVLLLRALRSGTDAKAAVAVLLAYYAVYLTSTIAFGPDAAILVGWACIGLVTTSLAREAYREDHQEGGKGP